LIKTESFISTFRKFTTTYQLFQSHFIEYIEEDKRVSIPEFYMQVLRIAVPDKTFISEIQTITIESQQPTVEIQAEPKEKDYAVRLEEDNYNRFMQETSHLSPTSLKKQNPQTRQPRKQGI
jgi:hypothetical protein